MRIWAEFHEGLSTPGVSCLSGWRAWWGCSSATCFGFREIDFSSRLFPLRIKDKAIGVFCPYFWLVGEVSSDFLYKWGNGFLVREECVLKLGVSVVNEKAEVNARRPLRWASSQVRSRFINVETSISGHTKRIFVSSYTSQYLLRAHHMPGRAPRTG